jgi:hypothetical protein
LGFILDFIRANFREPPFWILVTLVLVDLVGMGIILLAVAGLAMGWWQ